MAHVVANFNPLEAQRIYENSTHKQITEAYRSYIAFYTNNTKPNGR